MSIATFTLNNPINLETIRCYECGRYYAVEASHYNSQNCPYCAHNSVCRANARADAAERSKNSLRGALSRLKK